MSDVLDLRNAIFDRVSAMPGYTYATKRKTPLPTLQASELPALSIFIAGGRGTPDGDGNTGNIRLIEDDTIAISIARAGDDPVALEGGIDAELEAIKTLLFTDPTFVHFRDDFFFEALTETQRRWQFPSLGATYYIELQYGMTFRRRSVYDVTITDDYKKTVLTTRPLGKDTNTPAITTEIDLAQ